jgi:hypothetical protein
MSVRAPPEHFLDPITKRIMSEPVTLLANGKV